MTRIVFFRKTEQLASVWAKQGDPIPRAGEYVQLKNIAESGFTGMGSIVRNVRWVYDGQELDHIVLDME